MFKSSLRISYQKLFCLCFTYLVTTGKSSPSQSWRQMDTHWLRYPQVHLLQKLSQPRNPLGSCHTSQRWTLVEFCKIAKNFALLSTSQVRSLGIFVWPLWNRWRLHCDWRKAFHRPKDSLSILVFLEVFHRSRQVPLTIRNYLRDPMRWQWRADLPPWCVYYCLLILYRIVMHHLLNSKHFCLEQTQGSSGL